MPSMFIATITALLVWMNTSQGMEDLYQPWSIFFAVGVIVIYATGVIDDVLGLCGKIKAFHANHSSDLIADIKSLHQQSLWVLWNI